MSEKYIASENLEMLLKIAAMLVNDEYAIMLVYEDCGIYRLEYRWVGGGLGIEFMTSEEFDCEIDKIIKEIEESEE